jgi:2,3-bisphosphoglycerate-independent phosphoglycerate mutase
MVDFSPATPSSRVDARKKVFDEFLDLDPALKEEQYRQREAAKTAGMRQAFGAITQSPGLEGKLGATAATSQTQQQLAGMLPAQAMAVQAQAAQGAQMQQGIANAQSEQAVLGTAMGLEKGTADYARAVAQQAFAAGLDAKKAIFHANASFSDEAFQKLAKDFEEGRISKKELQTIASGIKQRLTERQQAAKEALKDAWLAFQKAMQQGNADREKSRVLAALQLQKDALLDAARAQQLAGILSGALKITATVI